MARSRRAWPSPIGDERYSDLPAAARAAGPDVAAAWVTPMVRSTKSVMARLTGTGSRTSARWPAPSSDDELGAGELGEGAAPVDVLAHVLVAVDDEHRARRCRGTAARTRSRSGRSPAPGLPRWRRGSRRSTPSPTPPRPRAASSSAARRAARRRRTRPSGGARCVITWRLNSSHPVGSSRTLVPRRRGRRPSAAAAGRGTARRGRWRRARRPARGGRRRARPPTSWRGSGRRRPPVAVSVASRTATMSATLAARVCSLDRRRSPGPAVAPAVERDDPVAAGEVRDERLPDPRVGDRRRRRPAAASVPPVDRTPRSGSATPSRSTVPVRSGSRALTPPPARRTRAAAG